ncbi:hypothetical protein [Desulfospira joergensenii]|uniref:hypothetical protein n=1 Tax=Desulfospira joergensenii TaxID=53329 RepID=UPI0003B38F46|nr:hypothetical protein [Desulfospira joergensenii]
MKFKMIKYIFLSLFFSMLTACTGSAGQKASQTVVLELDLSFADPAWNGKVIPKDQQCQEFGGNGSSPPIKVKDIPVQANKLIIEFSDGTYAPCDNGGHGIVSYQLKQGSKEIVVPSIPGQTFDIPSGFEMIKEHCGKNLNMKRGAYIGPCPGIGNQYYLIVKAVYEAPDKSENLLLGKGRLEMGTYQY